MRTRILASALAAAALAAAAAGPAGAAPLSRTARFVAYVEGRQDITWSVPRHGAGSSCQGQLWQEQGGKETIRFRTRPARLLVYSNAGYGPFVKYGTWSMFSEPRASGLEARGTMDRTGQIRYTLDPAVCHDAGDPTAWDTGPYDCGRRAFEQDVRLAWRGSRVAVDVGSLLLPSGDERAGYDDCPSAGPAGGFVTVDQRLPAREVFDRSQGLIVVLGRKTETEPLTHGGSVRTVTTFTLRLRRAR